MENKQSPSKKKLLSIQEEKLIREIDYDSLTRDSARLHKKQLLLDLEILQNRSTHHPAPQKVLVSIRPRAPVIKTLYIADKSRFNSKKGSDKSGSHLAFGDHSYLPAHLGEDLPDYINSITCSTDQEYLKRDTNSERYSKDSFQVVSSSTRTVCSNTPSKCNEFCNTIQRSTEKCYLSAKPPPYMNHPEAKANVDNRANKINIATLILTNTSSESSSPSITVINTLNKIIHHLERKILKQEMVFRSIDSNNLSSTSDEEPMHNKMKSTSGLARAGCSYIQGYSHVPETSAFQRNAQQTAPLSSNKAATLEKEHNSEQYGRDFTTYDGITARNRRQSSSVPCKREEIPKLAAERVHKIRHKLNPVRDYRLMDTVNYLAQGEFAPRDDGIKLTPSREAVLSDIIWEDVCRTHWPNARLGRRMGHTDRYNAKSELQRLIDSLLRERVAHVERRRRRHYRIVKLNHRHESCRPVGKTGDIIVASHKNRQGDDVIINEHTTTSAMMSERRWEDTSSRRSPRSHDCIESDKRQTRQAQDHSHAYENCPPGPSYAANRPSATREPTCCYQAINHPKSNKNSQIRTANRYNSSKELMSVSSSIGKTKAPRLVVKKEGSHRKYHSKEEPNLERYILLPTLVERTPSNIKRQKKFNELYHRILNVQLNNSNNFHNCGVGSESFPRNLRNPPTKDVGLNINVTLSPSADHMPG